MYIEFGMAQKYVDDLSKNVKRGLKTKSENGWYPGVAPIGYLNNTNKLTGETNLVKDPERFPLIRRMWDLMLTGRYTPPQIVELANNEWGFRTRLTRKMGDIPLGRSAIYRIFTRPFYHGWFEYPDGSGHWYRGKHEAMVTEVEFNRVQALLGRKGNPRPRTHGVFAFTGLIRCGECDGMVTAEEKHQLMCGICRFKFAYRSKKSCPRCQTAIEAMPNPHFLHYIYYHCGKSKYPSCTQKGLTAEALEKQIDQFLSRIQISERFKDWALKFLHELCEKESASRNDIIKTQQKAYQECLRRLDNLVRLKTSPDNADGSLLTDLEYGNQRMKLVKEKSTLEELYQDTGHRVERWLNLSEKALEFAWTARDRFRDGDFDTQKEILIASGSNLILKDKTLSIQASKPFLILETTLHDEKGQRMPFEPANVPVSHGQNEARASLRPSLCGDWDDVRTWKRRSERAAALIYAHFKNEFLSTIRRN
jgi:hypothetical protein